MVTVTSRKKRRKRRRTPLRVLEARGMKILKERGPVVDAGRSLYPVPSASSESHHDVRYSGGLWSCDCAYHASGHARCKHICAVRTMLLIWEEASREVKNARVEVPEIRCAKCKGTDFRESTTYEARRGTVTACRCDGPRRGCRFVWRPGFNGKRFSDEIITDALVDAAAGHPSPRIAERMKKNGVAVRARTIRRWIREYSDLMARFAATLPYRTGKRWSIDEKHLKTHPDRARKMYWLFAVLDNITGLILGYDVADDKLHYDATALLSRILEWLGRVPDVVIADKLNGYKKGFENAVRARNPSAVLVADVGVNGRHVNNNRRERLNGEFGDCLSRARGFRSRVPGLVALHVLYHNFIHEAGPSRITPAEAAGVVVAGLDRFKTLIQNAALAAAGGAARAA